MNTRHLLIGSLIGAAVSLVLANVPVLNLVNCLLCAGFWGGPLLGVWYYKRQAGTMTLGQGVAVGALAGLLAGVIGFLLSFVGLAGIQAVAQSYARLAPEGAGIEQPLALAEASLLNLGGIVFEIILGAIGGLIGGVIWRTRPAAGSPQA
jgi:hypothetical protein